MQHTDLTPDDLLAQKRKEFVEMHTEIFKQNCERVYGKFNANAFKLHMETLTRCINNIKIEENINVDVIEKETKCDAGIKIDMTDKEEEVSFYSCDRTSCTTYS